jgi:hypothetical protein
MQDHFLRPTLLFHILKVGADSSSFRARIAGKRASLNKPREAATEQSAGGAPHYKNWIDHAQHGQGLIANEQN